VDHGVCKGRVGGAEVIDDGQRSRTNGVGCVLFWSCRVQLVREGVDSLGAFDEGVIKAGSPHDVSLKRHV
jgi:hypothetical protein